MTMASRELNILIKAKNLASGAIASVKRDLGGIGSEAQRGLATAGRNIARGVTVAGIGAAVGIITQVRAGIESLQELQNVQAQTAAVLKSTAGAAGIQAEQVRNLAEKYEGLNATIDDKVIQSAENMLLTFTNVNDKAFEPALKAALDMNEAMGGGPEGLQTTMIRIGKALQDPVSGFTALRRVGVNLTMQQRDQIKELIRQNDLYGAQQIILRELGTEFGGSFAAAGKTFEGRMAAVSDSIEDAQMVLPTAFLPLMEKAAGKLQSFLADPAVMAGIEDFGASIAKAMDDALDFLTTEVDWDTVIDGLKTARDVAKTILDTFLSLPPWVQQAVITGWGLNKLTGGALGNIVGSLASGLIKGILNMNAGVVNINAGVVNSGGVPGVGGKGGFGLKGLALAGGAAGVIAAGTILSEGSNVAPEVQSGMFGQLLSQGVDLQEAINRSGTTLEGLWQFASKAENRAGIPVATLHEIDTLAEQLRPLPPGISSLKKELTSGFERSRATSADLLRLQRSEAGRVPAAVNAQRQAMVERLNRLESVTQAGTRSNAAWSARLSGQTASFIGKMGGVDAKLATIAAKSFTASFRITVPVTAQFSVSGISNKITEAWVASGKISAMGV